MTEEKEIEPVTRYLLESVVGSGCSKPPENLWEGAKNLLSEARRGLAIDTKYRCLGRDMIIEDIFKLRTLRHADPICQEIFTIHRASC